MKDENKIYRVFAFLLHEKTLDPMQDVPDCREDCHAGC